MNSFTDLLTLAQSEKKTWIVNYQTPAIYRQKHDARVEGYWTGNRYWSEAITGSHMRNFNEQVG